MRLIQLVEETYDLGKRIDEIFQKHIQPLLLDIKADKKINSLEIDIKKYFKDLAKRDDWEAVLNILIKDRMEVTKVEFHERDNGWLFKIIVPVNKKIIKINKINNLKNYFFELLLHEVTHILDRIRSNYKTMEPKFWKDKDETTLNYGKYYKDESEINSIISELKLYRKEFKRRWNNETKDENRLFQEIIKLTPALTNLDASQKKSFMRKIIKRLYREGMLSKNWTGR